VFNLYTDVVFFVYGVATPLFETTIDAISFAKSMAP
jgi:hypothetical protein